MRILFSGLVATGLLTSHIAAAASVCAHPADQAAFDVAALKTQLMVTALTCSDANPRYNAFIAKYRPELTAQDKALNGYFSRAYGRSGTKQRDDYVTNLANSQSETGLKQGTLLCERSLFMFDEVMALKSPAELPDYAGGHAVAQPISLTGCGAVPERPARAPARRRS